MRTRWSAVIPTRNRADLLTGILTCLTGQRLPGAVFEVLVVDSGSTDATPERVAAFIAAHPKHRIRYIREDIPGLLAGRHRGVREAQADILTFLDDDVLFGPDYALHILRAFADEHAVLVGGPSVPRYAIHPPDWVKTYIAKTPGKCACDYLSLLDYGNKAVNIAPEDVWGLNFSIRKHTLRELGGFHPDAYPNDLLVYRGDGETAPALKLKEQGLTARYEPGVRVEHIIPASRLTEEYFKYRAYCQGISDSYTAIRRERGVNNIAFPSYYAGQNGNTPEIRGRIHNSYVDGFVFHCNSVHKNSELLSWVLRDNYFDYALPDLDLGADCIKEMSGRPSEHLAEGGEVDRENFYNDLSKINHEIISLKNHNNYY
jgi:glycosyltransferase involved in cell wall biosynthesis